MNPVEALDRIVYLLDRVLAPGHKVRAFAKARDLVASMPETELRSLADEGRLQDLDGIGKATGGVIAEALAGDVPSYLADLEGRTDLPLGDGAELRAALKGDCHTHSTWSDGGAEIEKMATAAEALGHDYIVVTDHSPRLTVAHGLSRERLLAQLEEIAAVNERLAPFRVLSGIEVDIFEDGTLDQDEDMLDRLDVVVASVHSKFRMDRKQMTERMVIAAANPNVDILGHCTGRKLKGDGVDRTEIAREPTTFDPEIVFAACAQFGTAVEINCRPERQDPPDDLLALAVEWDCWISIDTDAHAPGQLEWQVFGCDKAVAHGIDAETVINTWSADDLVEWAAS